MNCAQCNRELREDITMPKTAHEIDAQPKFMRGHTICAVCYNDYLRNKDGPCMTKFPGPAPGTEVEE